MAHKAPKFTLALIFTGLTIITALYAILTSDPSQQVAIHWNFKGEANGYSSPLVAYSLLPFIQCVLLVFFSQIKRIDPRGKNLAASAKAMTAIITGVIMFLTSIEVFILATARGLNPGMNMITLLLSVTLIIIGNYMGKLQSSFFVGIRTPWTLSSEDIWRKTHRLGGKTLVIAGLVTFFMTFIVPSEYMIPLALSVIVLSLIIPVVYSWRLWHKEHKNPPIEHL